MCRGGSHACSVRRRFPLRRGGVALPFASVLPRFRYVRVRARHAVVSRVYVAGVGCRDVVLAGGVGVWAPPAVAGPLTPRGWDVHPSCPAERCGCRSVRPRIKALGTMGQLLSLVYRLVSIWDYFRGERLTAPVSVTLRGVEVTLRGWKRGLK